MTKSELSHYRLWKGIYGEPELTEGFDCWLTLGALLFHGIDCKYYIGSFPNEATYLGFIVEGKPFHPTERISNITTRTIMEMRQFQELMA